METVAKLRNAKISAQKVRLVVDQIRGLPVEQAVDLLRFSNKKAAHIVGRSLTLRLPMQSITRVLILTS